MFVRFTMLTDAKRAARAWVIACALTGLLPGWAAAEWRRLDSPNFIVVGDVSAGDLRDVAVRFEGFRETLSRIMSNSVTATAVPTVVIVFPHDRAFTPYKPLYKGKPISAAGVFYGGSDVNYITLVRSDTGSMRVIFHEYAHLVISNLAANLPVWLNEGLAEYYSTYESVRGGLEAVIGRPIESHVLMLREKTLVPVEQLTAVDHSSPLYNEEDRRSIFYAQSWALTHSLMLGDPPRTKELTAYMRHVHLGVPASDAWRQAFGDARIDQELSRHVRRESFKAYSFRFTDKLTAFDAGSRAMTGPEVSAVLAGLRLRQDRVDDAVKQVAEPPGPVDRHPHTNVVLAQLDLHRGDPEAAAKRLVPHAATEDWFVAYLAGVTLTNATERGREATADRLMAARAYFDALRRVREVPNALATQARLDLLSSDGPSAESRTAIERARILAPGRHEYVLIHARILAESGEFALARKTLSPMLAPGFPTHIRETARQWMANIVRMETSRRAGPGSTAPGVERPVSSSPSAMIPVYRTLQAAEQRTEGQLESIICPATGPALLVVRTDEGAQKFQVSKMSDVEFITYREDLTGEVACGPMKKPLPVFVTWKAGAAEMRIVVAVEFLPTR